MVMVIDIGNLRYGMIDLGNIGNLRYGDEPDASVLLLFG